MAHKWQSVCDNREIVFHLVLLIVRGSYGHCNIKEGRSETENRNPSVFLEKVPSTCLLIYMKLCEQITGSANLFYFLKGQMF